MATLTLRSQKGSPLTNQEVDDNFSNLNSSKLEVSGGTLTGPLSVTILTSSNVNGDEGGKLLLAKPDTNTTIDTSVTVKLYQNKLQIFETGGLYRGAHLDITTSAADIGSKILTSSNINSYAPTLTGVGASGTWSINITGNSATVTSITSSQVTSALGYTPYNNSNPSGYITGYTETDTLATVTGRGASTSTVVQLNGGGGDGLPALRINQTSAAGSANWLGSFINSGLNAAVGKWGLLLLGQAESNKNSGYLGFQWQGNSSNSNAVTLGLYAADNLLRVYGGGYTEMSGSARAPIFYDLDDTGFYLSPAAAGSVALRVQGEVRFHANDGNTTHFNYINGGSENYLRGTTYFDSGNVYFSSGKLRWTGAAYDWDDTSYYVDPNSLSNIYRLNVVGYNDSSPSATYGIQMGGGGAGIEVWNFNPGGSGAYRNLTFYGTGWNGSAVVTRDILTIGNYGGYVGIRNTSPNYELDITGTGYASNDFRAPIFYDSNDTGYYADFANTGTSINIAGSLRAATYNKPAIIAVASGSASTGGAIAIQQETSEGWTAIFADYEPYTGWGLWHDNPNNYFLITAESGTNSIDSNTVPSRSSGNRTAHTKFRFQQSDGILLVGGDVRAPIFYDRNDTGYFCNPNDTTTLNNLYVVGGVAGISNSSSYTEAALEIRERGFGGAQDDTWATAPRIGFHWGGRVASQIAMNSSGRISILNNPGNGYEALACGAFYPSITYDRDDTGYYVDPAGGNARISRDLYISGYTGGSYGNRLIVGNTDTSYTLQDGNVRPTIQAHGQYPVLSLNHTVTSNGSHGPTVQFTANGTGSQFVIGMNGNGTRLDIGVSSYGDWNPHNGIADYNGTTGWRMDNSGNVYNYVSNRSPIFYDSNDTGYYVNPNSTDYSARFAGNIYFTNYAKIGVEDGGMDCYLYITDNNPTIDGIGYGGEFYFYGDKSISSSYLNFGGAIVENILRANNSLRAPIFYDSNDTGYYADPNSTSNFANLTLGGRNMRSFEHNSFIEFYVEGDANTYYPVRFDVSAWMHWGRWSISRAYYDTAPWDPIGTGAHKGGLTFTWEWSGDGAWGGNDHNIRVVEWTEQYTTMIGGMALSVNGMIVWLRGGHAYYRFHGPGGMNNSATPYYTTYTAANGGTYAPRANASSAAGEINYRYPVRNNSQLYDNDRWVLHEEEWQNGKYFSNSGIIYANSSHRAPIFYDLDDTGYYVNPNSGSNLAGDVRTDQFYCRGWFRNDNSNQGLYNQTTTQHWSSNTNGYWDASSTTSVSAIRFYTGGHVSSLRGYVYADTGNNIGFLNSGGGWRLRVVSDDYTLVEGSSARAPIFYDSNDTDGLIDPVGHSRLKTAGHTSSGNVAALEIKNTGGTGDGDVAAISWHCSGYWGLQMHLRHDGYFGIGGWSASTWRWYVNTTNGDMTAAGNITAYSDPRLKQSIKPITNALDKVLQLDGVYFQWKDTSVIGSPGKYDYGVLAPQVEKVAPELVVDSVFTAPEGDKYKTVAYSKLVPILIEAIKEQQQQFDKQQQELQELKNLVKELLTQSR